MARNVKGRNWCVLGSAADDAPASEALRRVTHQAHKIGAILAPLLQVSTRPVVVRRRADSANRADLRGNRDRTIRRQIAAPSRPGVSG